MEAESTKRAVNTPVKRESSLLGFMGKTSGRRICPRQGNENLSGEIKQPHPHRYKGAHRRGNQLWILEQAHTRITAEKKPKTHRKQAHGLPGTAQTGQRVAEKVGEVKQGQNIQRDEQVQHV